MTVHKLYDLKLIRYNDFLNPDFAYDLTGPVANGRHGARDSGCSSAGEPSPNHDSLRNSHIFHRSLSSPVVEKRNRERSGSKGRPGT